MRHNQRAPDQLRNINFIRKCTKYAEGSILVHFGDTQVLCTASISQGVPPFLKGTGQGWLTAEYSMLPRATHTRVDRESVRGKQTGRSIEIQRLIGRSLRSAVDLKLLGERTITLDCDVLQADGGTRTAAITGGCMALYDALLHLYLHKKIETNPFKHWIAAVSVGVYQSTPLLDLDYEEDSNADMDMNVVMTETGNFLEVQGTSEKAPFNKAQLDSLLNLAQCGILEIINLQKNVIHSLQNDGE